jgi:hypothetical protein
LLAENLPKASIFFLSLLFTGALSGAAGKWYLSRSPLSLVDLTPLLLLDPQGNLLQVVRLAFFLIKVVLLGGSPRSVYSVNYTMDNTSFGATFPNQSLTAVIALSYSTIAPFGKHSYRRVGHLSCQVC